jgi:hypothetical protein
MNIYLYKDSEDLHWPKTEQPDKLHFIRENTNGYWDSHYRYHASFQQV